MPDQFDVMADELAQRPQDFEEECEAGFACHFHPVYGFVPEADCPVHDRADDGTLSSGQRAGDQK